MGNSLLYTFEPQAHIPVFFLEMLIHSGKENTGTNSLWFTYLCTRSALKLNKLFQEIFKFHTPVLILRLRFLKSEWPQIIWRFLPNLKTLRIYGILLFVWLGLTKWVADLHKLWYKLRKAGVLYQTCKFKIIC